MEARTDSTNVVACRATAAIAIAVLIVFPATAVADAAGEVRLAVAQEESRAYDPDYVGYTGDRWPRDYGIVGGVCDRVSVSEALGSGSTRRLTAILLGVVFGNVPGANLALVMDEADRACLGHALELARGWQKVLWSNPEGLVFALMPLRDSDVYGTPCREFSAQVSLGARRETLRGTACRDADGNWRII